MSRLYPHIDPLSRVTIILNSDKRKHLAHNTTDLSPKSTRFCRKMESLEENTELEIKMSDLYPRFLSGIKEHQAPSCLEMLRLEMYQAWIDGKGDASYHVTASEAVGMAIGHKHVQYVEYLLQEYPVQAMRTGGYRCSHVARAVETDLPAVVRRLLQHTLMLPASQNHRSKLYHYGFRFRKNIRSPCNGPKGLDSKFKSKKTKKVTMMSYLNKPSGCMVSGPSKTAVHLASEMGRAACLAELLHHGAIPTPKDNAGFNPLDCALRKLCSDSRSLNPAKLAQTLKELFPFLPVVQAAPETVDLVRKTAERADISPELKEILSWVLKEMGTPRSLEQICRHRIRTEIGHAGLQPVPVGVLQLPLPKLIKQYLFASF
ncbi:uncharacterized protein LOC119742335 [Patiria miniata]|uniref:SOCS box domain-containing protein n=1 Tax=Patiria miniata TaxID=46514 RepID=A0A914BFI4_PATMI|nr:uncharacterized protein LOC119742335 [Patiria miniata]